MLLSSGGQGTNCCWGSQISKGDKKFLNFQKVIAYPESWILSQQRQKNMSTDSTMTSSKGAKIAFSIELFSKIA